MGIKTWLSKRLGLGSEGMEEVPPALFFEMMGDAYVRELAFWSCVNTVANAVSKCEFKTFIKGKEAKGEEYYLWNIEPNLNQSSSVFLHKLITQLYRNNEALVVEQGGQLLVADSYSRKPYALYEDVFSQVSAGDFTFTRTFAQSEVLYFKLSEQDMRRVTNGLYTAYQKMIAYGMKSYERSRGNRGTLNVSAPAQGKPNFQETFATLMNERFKQFFEAESAVLPLFDGYTYDDLGSKTYSNDSTRDIRAMIDDVSDFTAKAFGIPPALLRGDVQGVSTALDQFLTFCIDPLTDMIAEEINRKRSGRKAYIDGTYVKIDTKCIKHVDLLSVSTAIDKLIASGAFCVNDIRDLVGEPMIDEPWAKQHFMTKNYQAVQDLLEALQNQPDPDTG